MASGTINELDFYHLQMHFQKSSQSQLLRGHFADSYRLCWQAFFPFSPYPSSPCLLLLHVPLGYNKFKKTPALQATDSFKKYVTSSSMICIYLSARYSPVTLVSRYPFSTAVVVVSISGELKEKFSEVFSIQCLCQKASDYFLLTVPVVSIYLNYKLIMVCIFF